MNWPVTVSLAVVLLIPQPTASRAAVEFGTGTSSPLDCDRLGRQVAGDWLMLRDFMAPGREDHRRPRQRDFQCVDPRYLRGLSERGVVGGARLRCFSHSQPNVGGICCDHDMNACVMFTGSSGR